MMETSAFLGAALRGLLQRVGTISSFSEKEMDRVVADLLAQKNGAGRAIYTGQGIVFCDCFREGGWAVFPRGGGVAIDMPKERGGRSVVLGGEVFNPRIWKIRSREEEEKMVPVRANRNLILFVFPPLSSPQTLREREEQERIVGDWQEVLCQIFGLSPPSK